jgi:hypothetical protein
MFSTQEFRDPGSASLWMLDLTAASSCTSGSSTNTLLFGGHIFGDVVTGDGTCAWINIGQSYLINPRLWRVFGVLHSQPKRQYVVQAVQWWWSSRQRLPLAIPLERRGGAVQLERVYQREQVYWVGDDLRNLRC